jgi:hypothetical protein
VVADGDAVAQGELGMDPAAAVVWREAASTWRITSVSQAWRMARGDGGRLRQA